MVDYDGRICEPVTDAVGESEGKKAESLEFPPLHSKKQDIRLFGCVDTCYVLADGKLYNTKDGLTLLDEGRLKLFDENGMSILAENVKCVAGGKGCYAYADFSGKAHLVVKNKPSDVFDGLCDIKQVYSDGKTNFYLLDSAGKVYAYNTLAPRSRMVFDKLLVSFEDYTETLCPSALFSNRKKAVNEKNWAESWVKETKYYKDAVIQYGEKNVGIKVYDSSKTGDDHQSIISVSFSVFTLKEESIPPVTLCDKTMYSVTEDKPQYVAGGFFTTADDVELFINCDVKKVVFDSQPSMVGLSRIFAAGTVKEMTQKPRIINKGLRLLPDSSVNVFDNTCYSWKPTSFPIKNVCDIAIFGDSNNKAAISKTNGEIIVLPYESLLKFSAGRVEILRLI